MRYAAALIMCLLAFPAWALFIEQPLPDPAQETRAKALFHDIRCVVCQSETIADSPADIASDMRRLVRARVASGDSDVGIKNFLVDQYGDAVLMRPPLNQSTFLLWFGPLLVLLSGSLFAWRFFRRKGVGA